MSHQPLTRGDEDLAPVFVPMFLNPRVLLDKHAGLDLHQLRHSAATHLGEAEVPLQLITGKTRHKNPRTALRYVKPGAEAIARRPAPPDDGTRCLT